MWGVKKARYYSFFNWVGFVSLFSKEVNRFLSVWLQTLLAPVVSSLLFFLVLVLALPHSSHLIHGLDFSIFIVPGIVMMSMAQNAFANPSSSLIIAKVQGNIRDLMIAPISPFEFVLAYMIAGMVRGLLVGFLSYLCLSLWGFVPVAHPFYCMAYAALGVMMLSLLGIIVGFLSRKFDHVAAYTNFFVAPLSFLSGTFFSIEALNSVFQRLVFFNPFFYMIDGFRYSFFGVSDVTGGSFVGIIVLCTLNCFLFLWAFLLLFRHRERCFIY